MLENTKIKIFVEIERLILRELLTTNVDEMFEFDQNVHSHLVNNPLTNKSQAAEAINFIRKQYIDNGIGRWTTIDKGTKFNFSF